ncbi:MAG: hypothetical protein Q8P90_04275 [bacterium]|nr:hypothetical protein [bacterium]
MERTFPSNFDDDNYRYLINASRFRYRQARVSDLNQEVRNSENLKNEIKFRLTGELREDAL